MTNPIQRDRREDDRKLVDLHVNIPTLAVIMIQTFGAAWAVSSLFYENTVQTKQLNEMATRLYQVERSIGASQVLESRMITFENELRLMRLHMERLDESKRR